MDWTDDGIVLSTRLHGESGLVASVLTHAHGRHSGFIPGGVSRRTRPIWQQGNVESPKHRFGAARIQMKRPVQGWDVAPTCLDFGRCRESQSYDQISVLRWIVETT